MKKPSEAVWQWLESGAWVGLAGKVLVAGAIVLVGVGLAQMIALALRRLRSRTRNGGPVIYIFEKLAGYGLTIAAGFVALSTLGVNLTSLAVFAGAIGVGVGLGLQGVVREFVSGLVILFDPLVQVGDYVELESGLRGEIIEVGPRATRLRTNDGLNVVIPNSKLIEERVVNWTFRGGVRRFHVPFSVAYGVDKALVRDVVLAAARTVPFTSPDTDHRKTQVWLTGFGDSGLQFELLVWPTPEAVKRPAALAAAYNWAIEDALRQAGVEIPFPQIDLRLRSLFGREGDAALRAMNLQTEKGAGRPRRRTGEAGPNDAAEDLVAEAEHEARERAEEEAARRSG